MGNGIAIGFILSLLILFSTLSYFHIERLNAQNLENLNSVTSVSNQALMQSMPYSIYATMIAEDDFDSTRLIRDASVLPYH